ncbi:MAG TPA: thiamine phosphate synthase [Candidatus Dormibacteraeota bacterium]|nr:thiamine phosphate synthase [Candidatus Dormibacteraeota bacterium]
MAIVSSADAGSRAAGRATILQLRAPQATAAAVEREAARLVPASPVPVVISSRIDVVLASDAAGVHLPERDISTADARQLMGHRIVGRSVHSVHAAKEAEQEGADYVVFGPVWASASHPDVAPVGLDALARVARSVRIPVLAIGGVTEERVAEVHRAGAAGFAAIGMFN